MLIKLKQSYLKSIKYFKSIMFVKKQASYSLQRLRI
jgi:hypothetical protein